MKKNFILCSLIVIGVLIFPGCSSDDSNAEIQEEFLTAKINGEDYLVGSSNSIIECKKRLTEYGSINLAVKARTEEGKIIEFLILNYRGANMYLIGNRTYSTGYSFLNGNWMEYSETLPLGVWSTRKNEYISDRAFVEITTDNGSVVTGTFAFNAQDEVGESIRSVSDGNFSIEIDR